MHKMTAMLTLCLLVLVGAFAPASSAENWPTFRGPGLDGHTGSAKLITEFGEDKNVKWKTAVEGKAWSSPVIWGDQIWTTNAFEDGTRLYAVVLDKNTGKVLNKKKWMLHSNPAPQYCHPFNSYASPSPTIEDGRVYITFGAPYTACIDTKTFKVIWERKDIKCNHFRGAGSSPTIHGDLLLMNYDGSDYQFAIALNKHTGETVWKTDRSVDFQDLNAEGKPDREGDWRKAFSTPIVHDFGNGPVMVSLGSKAIYGYEPLTGEELWRFSWTKPHSGSNTPVVGHGMLFFCTGASGQLWAVKPGGKGDVTETNVVWKYERKVGMKPSLLLVDDTLYTVSDAGILNCFDAKTGKELWKGRLAGKNRPAGEYSASPLYNNGKIYFFDQEGRATVIAHNRDELKVLATNDFDDGFMGSAAVDGNDLIVRTKSNVYRIGK
jgi:outer membrane protein assembly factor BamB